MQHNEHCFVMQIMKLFSVPPEADREHHLSMTFEKVQLFMLGETLVDQKFKAG